MKRILSMLLCLAMVIGFIPVFTLSAHAADGTWTLVTNVNDLAAGDQVIIAAAGYSYALSTTQNSNNRGRASITKNGDTVTLGDGVQVLTLEAGAVSGTFAFNTGSGYLYSASSSKNYLRTETKLSNNSSWSITISGDTTKIISQGTNTRNNMRYNKDDGLFASYASTSTMAAVCLYKLVKSTTPDTPSCDHAGAEWDNNETQHWKVCECGYTSTPADHDFTTNDTCECGFEKPAVPDVPATGTSFVKVTEEPADWSGTYLIVYEGDSTHAAVAFNGALSSVDVASNSVAVTIVDNKIVTDKTEVLNAVVTIAKNGSYYTIQTKNGTYIGHTSTSSNKLNSGTSKINNLIGFDGGKLKIKANASTEYFLQYNHASGDLRFRFYKSAQQAIALYKLVEATPEQPAVPAFDSASLVLQNDLAVQFNVPVAMFENTGYTNPYAVFTFDGKEYTVTEKTETTDSEGTAVYAFTFKNIAPHKAGKPISYTLKSTYNGEEVSSESGTYSVLTYCQNKLAETDAKLKTLVSDLLNYCAAVQASLGETELITDGVTGMTPTTNDVELESCTAVTKDTIANPVAVWDTATLVLKDNVTVRFYFAAESIDGLTVKIAGAKSATISEIKQEGEYYYVDFTGLLATDMRAEITATVYSGDAAVSEIVTYSIESYAARYQNVEANGMGALVKAMMKYGDSAANYS